MRIHPPALHCPYCGSPKISLLSSRHTPGRHRKFPVYHCSKCFLGFSVLQRKVPGYCLNGHELHQNNVKYQRVKKAPPRGRVGLFVRCKLCIRAAQRRFRLKGKNRIPMQSETGRVTALAQKRLV